MWLFCKVKDAESLGLKMVCIHVCTHTCTNMHGHTFKKGRQPPGFISLDLRLVLQAGRCHLITKISLELPDCVKYFAMYYCLKKQYSCPSNIILLGLQVLGNKSSVRPAWISINPSSPSKMLGARALPVVLPSSPELPTLHACGRCAPLLCTE